MEADPAEADTESPDEDGPNDVAGIRETIRNSIDSLGPLADKLKPQPLNPLAATAIAEVIDELAGGNTETHINTHGFGINRVAVITDGYTVRVLMLTSSWKWRGPYTPDDPEGYLNDRGYVPVREVSDGG